MNEILEEIRNGTDSDVPPVERRIPIQSPNSRRNTFTNSARDSTHMSSVLRVRSRRMVVPRRNQNRSSFETVTNINQFFNDDEDEEENRDHNALEDGANTTKKRDRSNLRNVS